MLRAVVLVLVSLVCAAASAQPGSAALRPQRRPPVSLHAQRPARSEPGRIARVGAIVGLAGAGLMLSGTLAIELVDHPNSERVTRGIHLGFTALAAPLVAFASYRVRRSDSGDGVPVLRAMGWGFYAGAIALGVGQWYNALHDQPVPMGLGYLYGSLAVLSLLPHCFDAYMTARNARLPALIVTPGGFVARF